MEIKSALALDRSAIKAYLLNSNNLKINDFSLRGYFDEEVSNI